MLQIIRNRLYRHVAPWFRSLGVPVTRSDRKLWQLKNKQKGKRAFIVGNGPSLRIEDLSLLHFKGEITLASNRIFLIFDKTAWRPTYYGLEDMVVGSTDAPRILASIASPILAASYLKPYFGRASQVVYFNLFPWAIPPLRPKTSTNILQGIYCGTTITYSLLQYAAWLGIREAYLLGVDFNYNIPQAGTFNNAEGVKVYKADNAKNYFIADYMKPGEVVVAPNLDAALCAFEAAKDNLHNAGIMKIYNATRGGKLEVFDRVDFDALF